jgi:putative transposase
MRLLAYCLMPNHWHLVLFPPHDGDMSRYLQWLTVTHMRRWHERHKSVGTGPLYQGRYKSFPIQRDEHFITVCRYVERNPLRCGLVKRAEQWRWGSASDAAGEPRPWITPRAGWPVPSPRDWTRFVNQPQTDGELAELRQSVNRGRPFGADAWRARTAAALGLQSSLRDRGRPRIAPARNAPK